MLDDGVLPEVLFVRNVPVPERSVSKNIRELAKRQMEKLERMARPPDKQLATCWDLISPCPFRVCCHGTPETEPGQVVGFRRRPT
jgi:hypothetical protein